MSASNIRAGKAYVELATKNNLLNQGLAAAEQSMRRLAATTRSISSTMGKGFASVGSGLGFLTSSVFNLKGLLGGLAVGSGIAAITKSFADAAGSVDDMSQRTGMTAEEISSLSYAAKLSGTSIGTVEKAIRKMQQTGAGDASKSTAENFLMLADQVARIDDPSQRAAEAMRIFGKSGAELLPMLNQGSAGIAKLQAEAGKLGVVMSSADAAAGAGLGDTIDRLWTSIGGLVNQIGAALAPVMTWLGDKLTEMVSFVANWIAENRKLVQNMAQLEMAGKIAMLGIEMAFRMGVQPLYDIWQDVQTWMLSTATSLVTSMVNVFAGIPTGLMNGFATVITWLTGTWDQTVNYIAKKLLYLYSLFDSSVDYENAAKQMDTDSASRASARQRSLDAANAARNESLQRANAERQQFADGMNANLRSGAEERKAGFNARINELGSEIASTFDAMRAEAQRLEEQQTSTAAAAIGAGVLAMPAAGAISEQMTARTQGTFSGFAAGFLGSGTSALDRLEKETKKGNQILEKIAANTAEDDDLTLE